MIEFGCRVVAQPGMDLGRLDDRARRRHQPMEPLRLLEPGDRPGIRIAGGDSFDGVEVRPDGRRIEVRGEGGQPRLVKHDPRPEIAPGAAEQDDADVQALAARTRTIAYWNALRGGSGTVRLLDEGAWRLESP